MTRFQVSGLLSAAVFGMATMILGSMLLFTFPSSADLSEGFRTPIIAFEFAKTEDDLSFLTGSGEAERSNREKMDAGHFWDMAFPFAYGGFLALMLLQIAPVTRHFTCLGVISAVAIIPLDINENLILLEITKALGNSSSTETLLAELQFATWAKWGALGICSAILAVGFATRKEYLPALVSVLPALAIALCWASDAEPLIAEVMSGLTFLFFLSLSIRVCIQAWVLIRPSG